MNNLPSRVPHLTGIILTNLTHPHHPAFDPALRHDYSKDLLSHLLYLSNLQEILEAFSNIPTILNTLHVHPKGWMPTFLDKLIEFEGLPLADDQFAFDLAVGFLRTASTNPTKAVEFINNALEDIPEVTEQAAIASTTIICLIILLIEAAQP